MDKDIVSTKEEDKPLIYISEEAINLKRDNDKYKKEIERLNNKLLKIKELINRTPSQTPKEIAYIMLKGEIAEVIGDDKE